MNPQKDAVKKVIAYMEGHLEEEIGLDEIAKNIGYSKFHLNRIFAEETGQTIYKYLQNRRLTVAAEKLVKTDLPIAQIAYETGYHSQQAFSLAFKQVYLDSPKAYRTKGNFIPRQNKISLCGYFCPSKYQKYGRKNEVAAA